MGAARASAPSWDRRAPARHPDMYPIRQNIMKRRSTSSIIRKAAMYIALAILLPLLIVFIVIWWNSGGPEPYLDTEGNVLKGSVSEKVMIDVGDAKLGCIIKGEHADNPVLLYLHGGMPDYFLTGEHPTGLDRIFTVAWLDQRGAGMSFAAGSGEGAIGLDLMVEDVRKVAEYLRARFGRERIHLMAHSGGTFLGIKVIEAHPGLFESYIGVAQIVYQKLSEQRAQEYILERYRGRADRAKIHDALAAAPIDLAKPIPASYIRYRDEAMHDLGVGTMRGMRSVISGIFIPSLLFDEYTLGDKLGLWRGKARSGISAMWDVILATDLRETSTRFQVPMYFLHGVHDHTVNYDLAREWYERIDAPRKAFFTFERSAHSPIFEEPAECVRVIGTEVLGRGEG